MKKTVKIAALLLFLMLAVVALTGCGNSETIVATLDREQFGITTSIRAEVELRGDRVVSVTTTTEVDNEAAAEQIYRTTNNLSGLNRGMDTEVTRDGNTITTVETVRDGYQGQTREQIVSALEGQGLTIED